MKQIICSFSLVLSLIHLHYLFAAHSHYKYLLLCLPLSTRNNWSKWHSNTNPRLTHCLAGTLHMRTAISSGYWQPWTAVSSLFVRTRKVLASLSAPLALIVACATNLTILLTMALSLYFSVYQCCHNYVVCLPVRDKIYLELTANGNELSLVFSQKDAMQLAYLGSCLSFHIVISVFCPLPSCVAMCESRRENDLRVSIFGHGFFNFQFSLNVSFSHKLTINFTKLTRVGLRWRVSRSQITKRMTFYFLF